MNKARRQSLQRIMDSLEILRDEEQDYLDNREDVFDPCNRKTWVAVDAVASLDDAIASMENAIG